MWCPLGTHILSQSHPLHVCRHSQLLYQQSHEQIWVYEATTGHYPRGNHPKIQPQKVSTQRFCIYGNPKRHVLLPQAGKISNDKLKLHLAKFWYELAPITPGLWRHQTRPLQFSLVVDDFWIKYKRQEDITHLLGALKTIYKISEEWDGKLYCSLNLEWDYYKREVLVSMPNLCDQSTSQISRSHPKACPICTPSMDAPKWCCNKTTRNSLAYPTANSIGNKTQHQKNYWNIPLLCPRCGLNYATSPQHTA